jgi:hypothetical protein
MKLSLHKIIYIIAGLEIRVRVTLLVLKHRRYLCRNIHYINITRRIATIQSIQKTSFSPMVGFYLRSCLFYIHFLISILKRFSTSKGFLRVYRDHVRLSERLSIRL